MLVCNVGVYPRGSVTQTKAVFTKIGEGRVCAKVLRKKRN